jgi:flagellar protein FliO/FliZ
MVVVLALVLAAIYGVYRLMKRLSRPKATDDKAVRVLASTSLGPGKALHVIGLGSKAYLIGATDASITLVAEVDDKDFIDALALEAAMAPQSALPDAGRDFSRLLSGLMGGLRGRGSATRKSGSKQRRDGDFLAGQRERLRKF